MTTPQAVMFIIAGLAMAAWIIACITPPPKLATRPTPWHQTRWVLETFGPQERDTLVEGFGVSGAALRRFEKIGLVRRLPDGRYELVPEAFV